MSLHKIQKKKDELRLSRSAAPDGLPAERTPARRRTTPLFTHLANISRSLAKFSEREKEMCFSCPHLNLSEVSTSAVRAGTNTTEPFKRRQGATSGRPITAQAPLAIWVWRPPRPCRHPWPFITSFLATVATSFISRNYPLTLNFATN